MLQLSDKFGESAQNFCWIVLTMPTDIDHVINNNNHEHEDK